MLQRRHGLWIGIIFFGYLLLSGCGQTGPLYPADQHNTPEHQNDQFLLQSSPKKTS